MADATVTPGMVAATSALTERGGALPRIGVTSASKDPRSSPTAAPPLVPPRSVNAANNNTSTMFDTDRDSDEARAAIASRNPESTLNENISLAMRQTMTYNV